MQGWASFATAGSALLAAVLSAVSLYYSIRRDRDRWARETVLELLVAYFESSFAMSTAVARLHGHHTEEMSLSEDELAACVTRIGETHDAQMATLTKLRFVAGRAVVEAAVDLHEAGHAYAHVGTRAGVARGSVETALENLWSARQKFLAVSKRELNLRGSLPPLRHTSRPPQVDDGLVGSSSA